MLTALILDDEVDARMVLRGMINMFCPAITSIHEAGEGSQAIALAKQYSIDIAFVDIELRSESGLELAQLLLPHCQHLIFVTAHDKYAVEAFQTPALHYLIKPVIPKQLKEAVTRVERFGEGKLITNKRLLLSTRTSLIILDQEEIMHIQGDGNYCHFY
ncbi:MAG: response regulator, partial [Bacteroidota bacterium]